MPTRFKTSGRTLVVENIVYAQTYPDVTLLYPAHYHCVRVTGEEAKTANQMMQAAGFIGNGDLLVNPARIVAAQDGGSVASLHLDGWEKALIVPANFLDALPGAAPHFPAPETSEDKPRRKKGAE